LYSGYRYPVEIISHCVWLYHRFPLSLRDVQEMMLQRGMTVSHEGTVKLAMIVIHFGYEPTRCSSSVG
jgi:transposase-like protein